MSKGRPTWVYIDLRALRHNLTRIQARIGSDRGLIGVVKANAYGHGAVTVARCLLRGGVGQLAVATVAEGLELRHAGIDAPILVFAGRYDEEAASLWQANLEAVVFGDDVLDELQDQHPEGAAPLRVHLHVDSGMGRLGCAPQAFPSLLDRIANHPSFELAGLMTHLACADDDQSQKTLEQLAVFDALMATVERVGVLRHAANSAAIAGYEQALYDAVRPGLALYGIEAVPDQPLGLKPVMSWQTQLSHLHTVSAGQSVGYGARWKATKTNRIGILPVGYADGYPWCAEGRAEVLIKGRRAKVVGAVSMDMIAIDLSEHPQAEVGDRVVLLGGDGEAQIRAEELASWSHRLVYEVLTSIGARVARRYSGQLLGDTA